MRFEPITHNDLKEINSLRPVDWGDIHPSFEFYVNSPFCYPIKTVMDGRIAGTGALIVFEHTCWLAHIIVDKEFRRRGLGRAITLELLKMAGKWSISTCLLIASEMGKPVYEKVGFTAITEYYFLDKEGSWRSDAKSENVIPFREEHRPAIYALDKQITGEDRERLLNGYLKNTLVYVENNKLLGYYMPGLKQGPIYAETNKAGVMLMKVKYPEAGTAVLPSDNVFALEFLQQNGFVITEKKGTRMFLGKEISWEPRKFYARIGGNLG